MIKEAIQHIPLSKDAYALSESMLVVRIRVAKNDISVINVHYGDRVCMTEPIDVISVNMEKIASDYYFDYYEGTIESPYSRVCYYFEISDSNGNVEYYSEYGFTHKMECHRTQYFQFPYLHREDIIKVPEWTEDMVMYHIFPDSFASDTGQISSVGKSIDINDGLSSRVHNGGTLQGIKENLDYIASLNVNCIYLNPIFKAASYHKYDTIDYFEVDPCFGTKDDLKELVSCCHERGIKVILDGVFNHCGSGFFAFRDVCEKGADSVYKNWFYKLNYPVDTCVPPNYEAFAYVPEMPKLNTGNKEVQEYFCNVGRYWIKEADIDGWRLDVANEINHDFWRAFRKAVKEEKSDAFMIGEIWEDSSVWLQGDQFDSTMNYSFSYICREFFAERKISASEFGYKINAMNLRYPEPVAQMQMNFLDTHDVPRFLSYCDGDVSRLKLAVFFMMTAQGIPSVFYGDEKAIQGVTEPEYRKPMPWKQEETLEGYYASMIKLRRDHKALQNGSFKVVLADDEQSVIVFERASEEERAYIIINNSDKDAEIVIGEKCKYSCPAMDAKIIF